jgi:DNA-binding GntR family transcriptional regulator
VTIDTKKGRTPAVPRYMQLAEELERAILRGDYRS